MGLFNVLSITKKMYKDFKIKSNGDFETIEFEFDRVNDKNELQIFDLKGSLLYKRILYSGEKILKMNISNFKPGMYISLFINETEAIAKKFIKS